VKLHEVLRYVLRELPPFETGNALTRAYRPSLTIGERVKAILSIQGAPGGCGREGARRNSVVEVLVNADVPAFNEGHIEPRERLMAHEKDCMLGCRMKAQSVFHPSQNILFLLSRLIRVDRNNSHLHLRFLRPRNEVSCLLVDQSVARKSNDIASWGREHFVKHSLSFLAPRGACQNSTLHNQG
jgi:hypothetical protein